MTVATKQQVIIRCRTKNFFKRINVMTSENVEHFTTSFKGKPGISEWYPKAYRGMNKLEMAFSDKKDALAAIDVVLNFIDTDEGEEEFVPTRNVGIQLVTATEEEVQDACTEFAGQIQKVDSLLATIEIAAIPTQEAEEAEESDEGSYCLDVYDFMWDHAETILKALQENNNAYQPHFTFSGSGIIANFRGEEDAKYAAFDVAAIDPYCNPVVVHVSFTIPHVPAGANGPWDNGEKPVVINGKASTETIVPGMFVVPSIDHVTMTICLYVYQDRIFKGLVNHEKVNVITKLHVGVIYQVNDWFTVSRVHGSLVTTFDDAEDALWYLANYHE